jgi:hypothetical protein
MGLARAVAAGEVILESLQLTKEDFLGRTWTGRDRNPINLDATIINVTSEFARKNARSAGHVPVVCHQIHLHDEGCRRAKENLSDNRLRIREGRGKFVVHASDQADTGCAGTLVEQVDILPVIAVASDNERSAELQSSINGTVDPTQGDALPFVMRATKHGDDVAIVVEHESSRVVK